MSRSSHLRQQCHTGVRLLSFAGLMLAMAAPLAHASPAQAQSAALPSVSYNAARNTIVVGNKYASGSPYARKPSDPAAPKDAITLPQLDEALAGQGQADLLEEQGAGSKVWLLKANVEIQQSARLDVNAETAAALRLNSTPNRTPTYVRIVAQGGHLKIDGSAVTSWNTLTGTPDENLADGRSSLLAFAGGRMDIINADVGYLGWQSGEESGLAWRKRGADDDTTTGATGSLTGSNVHHNLYGMYSYEAYGIEITNNQVHDNIEYGIDPHDYSENLEIAYNTVYNNGDHGIILSRGCINNKIHNNVVHDNVSTTGVPVHGIMLDRGSNNNEVYENEVYRQGDGIAIFQSSDNIVRDNNLYENARGVRINATYDTDDVFDGISKNNVIINNTIQSNTQYGVYLYERADKNRIENNKIGGNTTTGVYIKTGGNTIKGNIISGSSYGVHILGGPATTVTQPPGGPVPVPSEGVPGRDNVLTANTIDNNGSGIVIAGGVGNIIGARAAEQAGRDGNQINTNGAYGVRMSHVTNADGSVGAASTDNVVLGNTIQGNGSDGVLVKGAANVRNRISRNTLTANAARGIGVTDGANGGMAPPTMSAFGSTASGTTVPNATVEVYRDPAGEAEHFKGTTTADASGKWSMTITNDDARQGAITALAIAPDGNTSALAGSAAGSQPTVEVGTGRYGEQTIFVNGMAGTEVTLPVIKAGLVGNDTKLIEDQGNKVWQLNASLFIGKGVTLKLNTETVTWLKLRSQASDITIAAETPPAYNYKSFVKLITHNGKILIEGPANATDANRLRITSWDPQRNTYDTDLSNGRSFVLAKYDARMDVKNADLSYLGFADGEGYGVSWRDIDDADFPGQRLTRVTGEVINSTFSNNYYGVYTFQAQNMLFRGSQFYNNVGYGFDPHDYSHDFLVEGNKAYNNGNHGFIISRGVNNFVFRNNEAYNNRYTVDATRNAHGFMIDAGSPNTGMDPSFNNVLENNVSRDNQGYGLRILFSTNNTIKNNTFRNNLQGVTVEQGSTGNVIENNTIDASGLYGVYLVGGSDKTTVTGNTITKSGRNGVYMRTGQNTVANNTIDGNGNTTDKTGSGVALSPETATAPAAADLVLPGKTESLAATMTDLASDADAASALSGNVLRGNTITNNVDDGVELKGAASTTVDGNTISTNGVVGIYLSDGTSGSVITKNTITANGRYGIQANGADVQRNRWSENAIFDNRGTTGTGTTNLYPGIVVTGGANNGIAAPVMTGVQGQTVRGTALAGATVEIFTDAGTQGRFFEGRATAQADGTWSFTATRPWQAANITATATDTANNSSVFSKPVTYNAPVLSQKLYVPMVQR